MNEAVTAGSAWGSQALMEKSFSTIALSVALRKAWKTSKRFHRRLLSYSKAFEKPGLSQKGISQRCPKESLENPKGPLPSPSGLRVVRLSVNWEGKDGVK